MSALRLFPSGVVSRLNSASRFSMQVRKYFAFSALIFLLAFFNCFAHVNCFSGDLFNCFAHVNCFAHGPLNFIVSNLFNFIVCDLFNFITRNLFNCLAHNYTLIYLIFVERDIMIFMNILIAPILFLMWGYNITIDGNVCNVIEMCSTMFCIRCTTFGLFMRTINMFLHISIYGMYSFNIIFVHIQNLFHLIDGYLL